MNYGINVTLVRDKSFIFLLIGMLFILNVIPMHVLSPILIALFGLVFGILVISIFSPDDFGYLSNIYIIGFAVRIFLSFLFYISSFIIRGNYSPGFIFPNDGWSYSEQGWRIFEFAERGIKVTIETFMKNPNMLNLGPSSGNITVYDFFASQVYSITGYSPVSLFFISSLAGSLTGLFVYFMARELFSKTVARISSLFAFFWPSFIMWSTQNIKEPMITMFVCILLWTVFYMYRHFSLGFLLLSMVSLWVLFKIAFPYIFIILCMVIFTGLFLFTSHLFRNKFIAIVIIILLFGVSLLLLKDKIIALISEKSLYDIRSYSSMFEFINFNRSARAYGSLQFFANINISTFGRIITFAPLGLFYAVFAPFPWQLGSIMQIIVAPETILFYFLLPSTLRGIVFTYKKRFNQSLLLLSITTGIIIFLAFVEGNSGTLFRHRSVAFYLLFIFTSMGLILKRHSYAK